MIQLVISSLILLVVECQILRKIFREGVVKVLSLCLSPASGNTEIRVEQNKPEQFFFVKVLNGIENQLCREAFKGNLGLVRGSFMHCFIGKVSLQKLTRD